MRRGLPVALVLLAAAGYFCGQRSNPPGFYVDESSVAYNALCIATTGADEHGVRLPLFFRAFGEYKNPIYIYVLAAVFRFAEPSNLVARRVSAGAGFAAALLLGWLAMRVSRRVWIAGVVFLAALATPTLFEISRLAFEIALYPAVLALFLLASHAAANRERWGAGTVAALVATLALLTYTYSIGRLLGPMLGGLLVVFATRARLAALGATLAFFALTSVGPMVLFERAHPRALLQRFHDVSDVSALAGTPLELGAKFAKRYVANLNPASLALKGDPLPRHHVARGGGSILAASLLLAALGLVEALRRRDRWSIFVVCGAAASLVPASMTTDLLHTLRMVPFPVFLAVLSVPALQALAARPVALGAILLGGLAQAVFFFWAFHASGTERRVHFDVGFPRVLEAALGRNVRPIYLDLGDGYVHAYWYGALRGVPRSTFAPLPPRETPHDSVVLSGCEIPGLVVLSRRGTYCAYLTPPRRRP